jgi:nucleotide-binding universal stress UspA family protein
MLRGGREKRAMARTIEHILCPTDFSPNAQRALELSAALASRLHGRVTVLHAAPDSGPPAVRGSLALAPTDWPGARRDLVEDLESFCEPARQAGVRTDALLCAGNPVGMILEHARSLEAELLVMGTRGASTAVGWRLGSATAGVIARAPCPVLAVPKQSPSARPIGDIRRILCPMDFSEPGFHGLDYARTLARAFRARLVLLHVLEWFPDEGSTVESCCVGEYQVDLAWEARSRMKALAAACACEHEELVATGRPHLKILDLARVLKPDVIVLGVHGRREIDRVLPGGTITHVMREAVCPILVVAAPSQPAGQPVRHGLD